MKVYCLKTQKGDSLIELSIDEYSVSVHYTRSLTDLTKKISLANSFHGEEFQNDIIKISSLRSNPNIFEAVNEISAEVFSEISEKWALKYEIR